jgi:hypothetical protein
MAKHTGQHAEDSPAAAASPGPLWWLKQMLLTGIACFFVYFGIAMLVGAYRLNDPYSFIMTFFGASLMILISVVMAMGFLAQMVRMRRAIRSMENHKADP